MLIDLYVKHTIRVQQKHTRHNKYGDLLVLEMSPCSLMDVNMTFVSVLVRWDASEMKHQTKEIFLFWVLKATSQNLVFKR